jgi:hypothetical protein
VRRSTKIYSLLFGLLLGTSSLGAEELTTEDLAFFTTKQDSLSYFIRQSVLAKNEQERLEVNKRFKAHLHEALYHPQSFAFAFDSLKKYKMLLLSDDNLLRIITWNIPKDDRTQIYFGYVQHYNELKKTWDVFELKDKSGELRNPETLKLTEDNWYGAYYYKVITKKHKKKPTYTVLGWDGNTRLTQKKIIDFIHFNAQGQIFFGDDVFEVEKEINKSKTLMVWQKRVVFEFKQGIAMIVRYDESLNKIIYDHLSPEEITQKNMFQFYGPDLSFSAYVFKKGKWHYISNVEEGK